MKVKRVLGVFVRSLKIHKNLSEVLPGKSFDVWFAFVNSTVILPKALPYQVAFEILESNCHGHSHALLAVKRCG